jgi:hypothetical protein
LALVIETLVRLMQNMRTAFEEKYPGDQATTDEATKEWSEKYQALIDGEEYQLASTRRRELEVAYQAYLLKPDKPGNINPYATCHGYVWLFVRK